MTSKKSADQSLATPDSSDLLDLFNLFWEQRTQIAAGVVISLIFGALAAALLNTEYKSTVKVHPLSERQLSSFDLWNQSIWLLDEIQALNLNGVSRQRLSDTDLRSTSNTLQPIDEEFFKVKFTQRFKSGEELSRAIIEHSAALKALETDEQSLELVANSIAENFKLGSDNEGQLTIFVSTENPNEAIEIVKTAHKLISEQVNSDILHSFKSKFDAFRGYRALQVTHLNAQIEALSDIYHLRKDRRVSILREQAKIARELDFELPLDSQVSSGHSHSTQDASRMSHNDFSHSYFQGYRAIEKQIDVLLDRHEDEYLTMVPELDNKIFSKKILEDVTVDNSLLLILNSLPINDPNFRIVTLDFENSDFAAATSKRLLIVTAGLIGLLLSLAYAIVRHAFKSRSQPDVG